MSESKTDERKPIPFDRVLKRLLGTPPAPQVEKASGKPAAKRRQRPKDDKG